VFRAVAVGIVVGVSLGKGIVGVVTVVDVGALYLRIAAPIL
jgi:hypothetical protein